MTITAVKSAYTITVTQTNSSRAMLTMSVVKGSGGASYRAGPGILIDGNEISNSDRGSAKVFAHEDNWPHNTQLSQMSDDENHRTVTDSEKTTWGGKADANHNHSGVYQPVGSYEQTSNKNQASGYAGLDENGLIPASILPSYVDDIIEVAEYDSLPVTGESGKIYVTLDDNKTYRWAGTAYVEITASPGSTDAVAEGSTNLYFTEARVRGSVLTGLTAAAQRAALEATDSILTAFGKVKKYLADLGDAAFKNVGTGATDVAAGDHNHSGTYEPSGTVSSHVSTYEHHTPYQIWLDTIAVSRTSDTVVCIDMATEAAAVRMANSIIHRLARWTSSDGNTTKRGFVRYATSSGVRVTINLNGDAFVSGDINFKLSTPWILVQYKEWMIPGEMYADSSADIGMEFKIPGNRDWRGLCIGASLKTAAAGTGAELAFNIYDDGTGVCTNPIAFGSGSAVTNQAIANQVMLGDSRISVRITSSAGATNLAQGLNAMLYYTFDDYFDAV